MSSEERGSFEEQWQDAFEGAEMQPPAHLWSGIDGALANEEAGKLNKQVQIYRYVAAAAVLLCFSLVVYLMANDFLSGETDNLAETQGVSTTSSESVAELDSNKGNDISGIQIANENQEENNSTNESSLSQQFSTTSSQSVAELESNNSDGSSSANEASLLLQAPNNTSSQSVAELSGSDKIETTNAQQDFTTNSINPVNENNTIAKVENVNVDNTQGFETKSINNAMNQNVSDELTPGFTAYEGSERTILAVNEISRKDNNDPLSVGEELEVEVDGVAVYLPELRDKKRYLQDAWASVEFGGGLFEPNYNAQGGGLEARSAAFTADREMNLLASGARYDNSSVQNNEDMTAGSSYVMGMNYGTRLNKRIILQSGVQYGIYESSSVTNTVFETSATTGYALSEQTLNDPALNRVVAEGNYQIRYENVELRNTFRMASVPVKAGYVIMDQKLNIMLDGGIQANLFLGNELSDPDNNLETIEIRPGETSPYRTINFSAITGVTLGYSFLDNYALTVKPSYQRSINSLTKETSSFSATPEGFGLSVGVRYIFQ
ncbi:MAG: hypothetical protein NXI20_20740 [bacterium]|nr:hypothetical protein [bacterium]